MRFELQQPSHRLAVTLGGLLLLLLVLLVEADPQPSSLFGSVERSTTVSAASVGIAPVVSGFLLVELGALVVPSLRRRRVAGWEARRGLRMASWVLSGLIAAIQIGTIVRASESGFLMAATLALGTAAAWLVFVAIERWGLGSGYAVASLMVLEPWSAVRGLWTGVVEDSSTPGAALLVIAMAAGGAAFLFLRTTRPTTQGAERMVAPIPVSGLGISASAFAALSLPATFAAFGLPGAESVNGVLMNDRFIYLGAGALLMVLFALFWSVLFFRPSVVTGVWKQWNPSLDATSLLLSARALVPTAIRDALAVNLGFVLLHGFLGLQGAPLVTGVLPVTLAGIDLANEWSFRQEHGALERVWEVHRVYEIDALLRRLESEGLHPFARGRHLRAAFQFFGPFVPVSIVVPTAEAAKARELVDA